jgi:hypothetical protein
MPRGYLKLCAAKRSGGPEIPLFVLEVPEEAAPWVRSFADPQIPFLVLEIPKEAAREVRNLAEANPETRIKALTQLMLQAEAAREAAVAGARGMRPKPATWKQIGRAAGLAETTAQAKWKRLDPKYSGKRRGA